MNSQNPDWILVEGGSPEAIRDAVIEHSELFQKQRPQRHQVRVLAVDRDHFAVKLEPRVQPYTFTNLICWLDDGNYNRGARQAVGWITSPGNGVRYFFGLDQDQCGDTLAGVSSNGEHVSLYLPDCGLSLGNGNVDIVSEPDFPRDARSLAEFDVTFDVVLDSGNPQFLVGG